MKNKKVIIILWFLVALVILPAAVSTVVFITYRLVLAASLILAAIALLKIAR